MWKKITMAKYYNNIETSLIDASIKGYKIYWKHLKDVFKSKDTPPPPLQVVKENGNLHINSANSIRLRPKIIILYLFHLQLTTNPLSQNVPYFIKLYSIELQL